MKQDAMPAASREAELAASIEAMRPALLRLANLQLRNEAWAEDAVSEATLAALQGLHKFAGNSQFKTWVVGILKHKVLDQLRLHAREQQVETNEDDDGDIDDHIFQPDGHFRQMPQEWTDPADQLQRRQFFEVLEACMDHLPGKLGRVFLMREWLGLETEAICQEIGIAPTNLWVMLHRARMRLRECLQLNWFGNLAK